MTNLKVVKEQLAAGEISVAEADEKIKEHVSAIEGARTYRPPTAEDKKKQYEADKARRALSQSQAIPFIHLDFDDGFALTQGLYLVGAKSGQGKSTTVANILATFVEQVPRKRALVLTNEETSQVVYDRVSCVMLRKSFIKLMKSKLSPRDRQAVEEMSGKLIERLDVESGESNYDMSCIEDVKGVLTYAENNAEVGLIVLDYYQTVNQSRERPEQESFGVLKRLGYFLKDYGRRSTVPVVAMAQLNPSDKNPDFAQRVQNDRTIYNHCYAAIEVVPDFETGITKFVIHKDRYGQQQGREIEMAYKDGAFVPVGSGI